MDLNKVELFGTAVLVEPVKRKKLGGIITPENMKPDSAINDLVVLKVGSDVTKVQAGDTVVMQFPGTHRAVPGPNDRVVFLIEEGEIKGRIWE